MFGNTDGRNRWIQWRQLLRIRARLNMHRPLLLAVPVLVVLAFAASQALLGTSLRSLAAMPPKIQAETGNATLPVGAEHSIAAAPSKADQNGLPSKPDAVDAFI